MIESLKVPFDGEQSKQVSQQIAIINQPNGSATQTMGRGPVPGRGGLATGPWTDTQICILHNT